MVQIHSGLKVMGESSRQARAACTSGGALARARPLFSAVSGCGT